MKHFQYLQVALYFIIDFIETHQMGCTTYKAEQDSNILQQKIKNTVSHALAHQNASQVIEKMKDVTSYIMNQTKLYMVKKYKRRLREFMEAADTQLGAKELKSSLINDVALNGMMLFRSKLKGLEENLSDDLEIYERKVSNSQKKILPKSRRKLLASIQVRDNNTQIQKIQQGSSLLIQKRKSKKIDKESLQKGSLQTENQSVRLSNSSNKVLFEEVQLQRLSSEGFSRYQEQLKIQKSYLQDMQKQNNQLNQQILISQNIKKKFQQSINRQDCISKHQMRNHQQERHPSSIFLINNYSFIKQAYTQTQEEQKSYLNKFVSPVIEKQTLKLFKESKILPNFQDISQYMNSRLLICSFFSQKIKSKAFYRSEKQYVGEKFHTSKSSKTMILMSLSDDQIIGAFLGPSTRESQLLPILFSINKKESIINKEEASLIDNPSIQSSSYEGLYTKVKIIGKNYLAIKLQCEYLLKNYRVLFESFLGNDLSNSNIRSYQLYQLQFESYP